MDVPAGLVARGVRQSAGERLDRVPGGSTSLGHFDGIEAICIAGVDDRRRRGGWNHPGADLCPRERRLDVQ